MRPMMELCKNIFPIDFRFAVMHGVPCFWPHNGKGLRESIGIFCALMGFKELEKRSGRFEKKEMDIPGGRPLSVDADASCFSNGKRPNNRIGPCCRSYRTGRFNPGRAKYGNTKLCLHVEFSGLGCVQ